MPEKPSTTETRDVTITVSGIPEDLLREIDELAKGEDRTRSGFLRRELAEAVRRRRPRLNQQAA